jgi:hypothetical protein
MIQIPDSGLYYPNNLSRAFLLALEDVMGVNGLNAILNLANQSKFIGNYPADDSDIKFDFAYISSIIGATEEMYGPKGGRILSMRAGQATFKQMIADVGEPVDPNDETFKALSIANKLQFGMTFIRSTFTGTKTAPVPQMDGGEFLYKVPYCSCCWGRTTETYTCFLTTGLLRATLRWITNGLDFNITQITARSCGDVSCDYIVPIIPME